MVPTLIESELFGYTKGAFTGAMQTKQGLIEAANAGTLFLDEIGDMPLEMQTKLLRALPQHEIKPVGSTSQCGDAGKNRLKRSGRLAARTTGNL